MKHILFPLCIAMSLNAGAQGRVGIGNNDPQSQLSVGNASQFRVDSVGNIVMINGVATGFPAGQGDRNTVYRNDGYGNITWAKNLPSGSIISSYNISPLLDSAGFTLIGKHFINNFSTFIDRKQGGWSMGTPLTRPDAATPYASDFTYSSTFGEFTSYDNGYLYFNTYDGTSWFRSSLVNIAGFDVARNNYKIVSSGKYVFVLSGQKPGSYQAVKKSARYDVEANTWSAIADMPDSIMSYNVCADSQFVYVFGGYKVINDGIINVYNINQLYIYNINNNTWSTQVCTSGQFPINGSCIKVNNQIRYAGGYNQLQPSLYYYSLDLTSYSSSLVRLLPTGTINHLSFTKDSTDQLWMAITNTAGYFIRHSSTGAYVPSYEVAANGDPFLIYGNGGSVWKNGKMYIRTYLGLYIYDPLALPAKEVWGEPGSLPLYLYERQ